MDITFVLIGFVSAMGIIISVLYYSKKPKLKPLIVGTSGPLRNDEDIIVRHQPVIVNVLFETAEDLNQGLLADVVINYKDLISGKYKTPARYQVSEESLEVVQEKIVYEVKAPSVDPEEVEEEKPDMTDQPEIPLFHPSEDMIPAPDEEERQEDSFKPVDVSTTNFNF